MDSSPTSPPRFGALAVPLFVLLLAVAARALVQLHPSLQPLANVSALPAVTFAAGYLLRRWWAPLVVVGAMMAVDVWVDPAAMTLYWPSIFAAYALFLVIGFWGLRLPGSTTNGGLLGRSLLACGAFYLFTNTISWLTTIGYERGLVGWLQALTVGLPGFRPTWSFGLQMTLSTLLFTAVILLLFRRHAAWLPERAQATAGPQAVVAGR